MTTVTKENRFGPYEILVDAYHKHRDAATLETLLELQCIYDGFDWAEVYHVDEIGVPHYRVKEDV